MAFSRSTLALFAAALLLTTACDEDDCEATSCDEVDAGDPATDAGPPDPPPPEEFADVEQTGRFRIPNLSEPAHVVRTEHFVPHVYAANDADAQRVLGFVIARDRYFQLDVVSRLSQGLISELLGDVGLASDIENRMTGADLLTQIYTDSLTPEEGELVDAFAEGINAYVTAVAENRLDPPKEFELAFGLLGARRPADVMREWTRRDVMALAATMTFQTGYDTKGPGRARALERIDSHFESAPNRDLRMAGLMDIVDRWAPPQPTPSANGWGIDGSGTTSLPIVQPGPRGRPAFAPVAVEDAALNRLIRRLDEHRARMHPAALEGWGSNVWAVMGSGTSDGRALLAGDGHLQLSIPSLMWEYAIDTERMGDEDPVTVAGVSLIGAPGIATGTNGRVAWGGTNFVTDVTDWYSEEIVLDDDGAPSASMFGGEARPLSQVDETYDIADVAALDSEGRTLTLARYVTFDGRMLTSIEGREATEDEVLGPGETLVNMMGDWIVPGDVDGDGVVTAMSFYYAPFDGGSLLRAVMAFQEADTVEDFRLAMRHVIGFGLNFAAADRDGGVVYTGYHAMPCRTYLPRDETTGRFEAGADPTLIIDGTQHPAWRIPLDDQGRVDEAAAAGGDATACAVPFDEWPQALNPTRQYVVNANNDPGDISSDNDPWNDPYYIGGPWDPGYRVTRIAERLEEEIGDGSADLAAMQAIQGDHQSLLGRQFTPLLLEVIGAARDAASGTPAAGSPDERMAALYTANAAAFDEVEARIIDWRDDGFEAASGVDTFYSESDEQSRRDAVATMIFAAWLPRFMQQVWNDEGIDGGVNPGGNWQLRTLHRLVDGRGADDPLSLPSFDAATGESVYFDDVATPETESSQELGVRALADALAFLSGPTEEDGESGGFGTDDMDQWLWGLRHQVRFESLLADFIGDDESLQFLFDMFNVDTSKLPLAEGLAADDPRAALTWFPRPGDQYGVDAANPGFSGTRFTHRNGPVMRTVVALGPDGVEGFNSIPGGQSGNPDSEHFDDRARNWLANETVPLRFTPAEVAEGAVSRELFLPAE